jgi:hypothetical protein
LWPGIKVITGMHAEEGHSEYGVSRGCLLPAHNVFSKEEITKEIEEKILNSMVIVHGGISQDVGPILEMVTEKYLLKYEEEWKARKKGIELFDKIVDALKAGDMKKLGSLTTEDWEDAIQKVIPWVNNAFTDDLIMKLNEEFKEDYWGFLMLGGMSGGGMAFIINPDIKKVFKKRTAEIMLELKQIYNSSYPFIIEPVVYDFEMNHEGIVAKLLTGEDAKIPETDSISIDKKEPVTTSQEITAEGIKQKYGFDARSHEYIKSMLKSGEIGLAKNRLSLTTKIEDVEYDEILHFENENPHLNKGWQIEGYDYNQFYETGMDSLRKNEIAVVTFAGGMGSRWTHGAAVVKPINPFINIENKYRTFIEIHLAKSKKTGQLSGNEIPHVFTTSYLTHDAIIQYLEAFNYFDYRDGLYLSPAKSIGHRVYPMEKDLRFHWEEQLQQKLDENIQKVQDNIHRALIEWSKSRGEGDDYSENKPILRFNPPGHWYEIPNLLKNGILAKILKVNPDLKYLFCHNIDTLGAYIEPLLLGVHIAGSSCLTFEVTPRRIEDAGGGLAKIDGHIRLIEGLALPHEEDEYKLSYYNTLTNWITIDPLLEFFGLDRDTMIASENGSKKQNKIQDAIYGIEKMIPTYVTIKNVKYVWGSGQEDVYPIAQFEKLWGDMTAFKDLKTGYLAVSRYRGSQLKEPALLDIWANNGSFDYIKGKCKF